MRRRSLMQFIPAENEVNLLPSGYTALEYIESTGKEYIETGYIPKKNTITRCRFVKASDNQAEYAAVYGCQNASNGVPGWMIFISNSVTEVAGRAIRTSIYTTEKYMVDKLYDTTLEFNKLIANGKVGTVNDPWEDLTYTLWLFTRHGLSSTNSKIKMYSFQIYESSELIMDLIPAVRTVDGEVGMFDTVTNRFLTNISGSGKLLAGPTLNLDDFIKLEYIESTGKQYIDTKLSGYSDNFSISMDCAVTDVVMVSGAPANNYFFGAHGKNDGNNYYALLGVSKANSSVPYYRLLFSQNSQFINIQDVSLNTRMEHSYTVTPSTNGYLVKMSIGDRSAEKTATSVGLTSANVFLLGSNGINNDPTTEALHAKIYGAKMIYNNVLMRDFIPVKRKTDNAVGLFDLVTKEFYPSNTSTPFVAGPILYM